MDVFSADQEQNSGIEKEETIQEMRNYICTYDELCHDKIFTAY